ncbi:MAG: bacteriorhodopsin, partial [Gemmatimonadaceae bacterium]|nr:bacteriorhodopsin [Gemmatimonadaceae bacterium]
MYESYLTAFYVLAMAAGALTFTLLARRPRGVPHYEYMIAIMIPVWSGAAYLAMVFDQGKSEAFGQVAYWARYVDWVVTTPLLLLALAFTALHETADKKPFIPLLVGLVAADVFMILTGLVADLSPYPLRYLWYVLGCAALVIVFSIIWGPLRRVADASSPGLSRVYRRVVTTLTPALLDPRPVGRGRDLADGGDDALRRLADTQQGGVEPDGPAEPAVAASGRAGHGAHGVRAGL